MKTRVYDFSLKMHENDHYKIMLAMYNQLLEAQLRAWGGLSRCQDELIEDGAITPQERFVNSQAIYDGTILRITIGDVLPRIPKGSKIPAAIMHRYWNELITDAVCQLETPIHFEQAVCAIKVYARTAEQWDVDNKALNYAINALRVNGVISGDEYYKLSLVLLGGHDRERPRTEIWLREYSEPAMNGLFPGI